jgi:ATP-binding cassette subfamily B protein
MMWQLLAGQRLRYLAAIGAMLLVVFSSYLIPLVIMYTIDLVLDPRQRTEGTPGLVLGLVDRLGGAEGLKHRLWIPALAVLVLALLNGLFIYLRGRWSAVAAESIARHTRNRLYSHLHELPCRYFDQANTGDLVQRCTSDVETVRSFLASQVVEIGRAVFMFVAVIPILLALDVRMTAISLLVVPFILFYAVAFFRRAQATFKLQDEAEGDMTERLQENLTGIRVVRAFARQDHECREFDTRNVTYRTRSFRLTRLLAFYYPSSDFLAMAQVGVVLLVGGHYLLKGEISVGTFYAFLHYVGNLLWPIRQMGRTLVEVGKAFVSMDRLQEILGQPPEVSPTGPEARPAGGLHGAMACRNLSLRHGESPVLRDVSFDVPAGGTLAILGSSGSGKSVLVSLLLKFYDYDGGSITMDGRELRELNNDYVRSQIGVVLQEPFLYSRSIRENIKFGRSAAPDDEIQRAARMACIHETITTFEGSYGALVGERGVTLSGGQRQRVALARAILKEPPILILDDALSAVDTRTESLILEALRQRHGRQTTLVIAHRLSTLMQADRILVLEKGRVVQSGTHEELVRQSGLYRRLWQIQTSLEEDLDRDLKAAPAAGTP